MKILIAAHVFYPSVGGIEQVTAIMAEAFTQMGHEVVLLTQTPNDAKDDYPFQVVRQPSALTVRKWAKWADVFWQNNISLRTLWPVLVGCNIPKIVTHQTWLTRTDGSSGWQDRVKQWLCSHVHNVCISQAVANSLSVDAEVVIGNPFDENNFILANTVERDLDLVFLGRLVSDKGADLVVQAVQELAATGISLSLTIVGEGEERTHLETLARGNEHIQFLGQQSGKTLSRTLNRHKCLVAPSRWAEPFGIVALEGIACGCMIIGSEAGGLPEAMGPCGVTFPNDDLDALKHLLIKLNKGELMPQNYTAHAEEHLAKFTTTHVAKAYLKLFEESVNR